jgi:UDP:flavonoid glycosyltransferase YjiC (YdhE family)
VRVLLSSLPATGHFNSLLPLADGLAEAGHAVAVCCTPAFADAVTDAGFEHLPGGAATFEELFVDAPPRTDPGRLRWAQRVAFTTRAVEAMLPDLERHARERKPDVIVRESAEYAGYLVAERLEMPHAAVATGSRSALDKLRLINADLLDGWRRRLGLEPDRRALMLHRYLLLAFTPPRWDEGDVHPATTHYIRYANPAARRESRPAWLDARRDRPLVLASLGTVHHSESGLFEAILEAVADEPVEVIVAIGRERDPASLHAPPNVRLEPYVPQIAVLEEAAAFITHGGFNSTKEALSLGVPLVVIPIGADQPYTAERVEALGLGRHVAPDERTPDTIRAKLREVMTDPAYRTNAERFAAEMAALPPVSHAVGLIEQLVSAEGAARRR